MLTLPKVHSVIQKGTNLKGEVCSIWYINILKGYIKIQIIRIFNSIILVLKMMNHRNHHFK